MTAVQVEVVPDMSVVNVTWSARGDEKDEQIAALLPTCASQLRCVPLVLALYLTDVCTTCPLFVLD